MSKSRTIIISLIVAAIFILPMAAVVAFGTSREYECTSAKWVDDGTGHAVVYKPMHCEWSK